MYKMESIYKKPLHEHLFEIENRVYKNLRKNVFSSIGDDLKIKEYKSILENLYEYYENYCSRIDNEYFRNHYFNLEIIYTQIYIYWILLDKLQPGAYNFHPSVIIFGILEKYDIQLQYFSFKVNKHKKISIDHYLSKFKNTVNILEIKYKYTENSDFIDIYINYMPGNTIKGYKTFMGYIFDLPNIQPTHYMLNNFNISVEPGWIIYK